MKNLRKIGDASVLPGTSDGVWRWIVFFTYWALYFAIFAIVVSILVYTISTKNNLAQLLAGPPPSIGTCPTAAIQQRQANAYALRMQVALAEYVVPVPCPANNGDESLYAGVGYPSQFTKALQHDATTGLVYPASYQALLAACTSTETSFNGVPLAAGAVVKLIDPLAGLAFDLLGADSHALIAPPAPTLASTETAAEYIELAWMARARDVPFAQYGSEPITTAAIAELTSLGAAYNGLKPISAATLFRPNLPGTSVGPYISQFLYLNCTFGANQLNQLIYPPIANVSFVTDWSTFIGLQNGGGPSGSITLQANQRYLLTGRDLAFYVRNDLLYQEFLMAHQILQTLGVPYNPTNPYLAAGQNQNGFGTFGAPHVATLLAEVTTHALHTAWNSKWFIHRRLRPEEYAGLVGRTSFPNSLAPNSQIAAWLNATYGTYLLPQVYPEGAPIHPSYPGGHATVAGACATILKAFYDGSSNIPSPVMPNANGSSLLPYTAGSLTVTGELNKLAGNAGVGRNMAGVNFLSDAMTGFTLGEQVAIKVLRDYKPTFAETFGGWIFTGFDGQIKFI